MKLTLFKFISMLSSQICSNIRLHLEQLIDLRIMQKIWSSFFMSLYAISLLCYCPLAVYSVGHVHVGTLMGVCPIYQASFQPSLVCIS